MGLLTLKNDAVVYFLPYRYHISESIQNGFFPYWNPYIYMGFPLHGDMQSGAWNPFVWLFSLLGTYNMRTLQWETLLYIYIAGIGMYKLLSAFAFHEKTKWLLAIAYLCSGFITDTGQFIVWTASAAFVPFVLLYYYRLLQEQRTADALKTAIALALLLLCGYPSFLIFTAYLLLAMKLTVLITRWRRKTLHKKLLLASAKNHLLILLVFAALCAPALAAYYQNLPLYERGSGATLAKALSNPFPPFSLTSWLTPMAVTRPHDFISTDLTARNSYFGIFSLLFLLLSFRTGWSRVQSFIAGATGFALLFSFGDATPLRKLCYYLLPLMDTFRHPANMRLFTIIGCLLLAGFALHRFFTEQEKMLPRVRRSAWWIAGLTALLVLWSATHTQLFQHIKALFAASGSSLRIALKEAMDDFGFWDYALLQGVAQLIFVLLFIWLLRSNRWLRSANALMLINLLLMAQLALPFTFVGQSSPRELNAFIAAQPKAFPLPDLSVPVDECSARENATDGWGNHSFYEKSLCIEDNMITPSFLKQYDAFLKNNTVRSTIAALPFAWCTDSVADRFDTAALVPGKKYAFIHTAALPTVVGESKPSQLRVVSFAPDHIRFEINCRMVTYLNILQNYHPDWQASINGNTAAVLQSNISFMSVQVPAGVSEVVLEYKPRLVSAMLWVSAGALIALLLIFIFYKKKIQAAVITDEEK
jgi:hypothetical protein